MKKSILILLIIAINTILFSQELKPIEGGEISYEKKSNCLSPEQREEISQQLKNNKRALREAGILNEVDERSNVIVAFDWPLQKTSGLTFNSYYATNNFVDQDTGAGLLDYNCDARTYDGHNGTDIDTWPFPWYIYDNDFVEVIAGEAGTIIDKIDGNDDDHCSCSGVWNAIFIEHADGSSAWYGHMKKNSLTSKTIGETVSKGEYLGVVASSGCSTAPHLHFEVFDDLDNLIDPYSGACNSLNGNSWWDSQRPNREPTLNALLTHDAVPVHGCPGTNESPNMSNDFAPGEVVYMAGYYHDQLAGDVSNLKVRRPDNSIWQSWTHTSDNTYTKSWWLWNWTLPSGGPFGTWKFEIEYNGETFQHEFQYISPLPVELLSFTAKKRDANVIQLDWQTSSETNNLGFVVEKSNTGIHWEELAFIDGAGNSQDPKSYQTLDRDPFVGQNYYRLKQIDFEGSFEYSDIRVVNYEKEGDHFLKVFPNPNDGFFTIRLHNPELKKAFIKLLDSTGNLIWHQDFRNQGIQILWEKEFNLPQREVYFLVTQIGDIVETQKVVIIDKK